MLAFWETEKIYNENYNERFPVILAGVNFLIGGLGTILVITMRPCNYKDRFFEIYNE